MAAQRTIALPERYHVERRIASGGMASVWAARDEVLRRRVAVKVLSSVFGEDEEHRARFQREAHATARMSDCAHVVTIYDIGEHAGRAYIVMELLDGGTVADRLREPGLVDRATALRWVRETATALDCAHGHGIVHRDIKPANLLLDADDRLAVADFGIAQLSDATRELTATGTVLGTAAYLSPEQALGEPATAASDRYALAAVAWELLTGERPYRAEHFAAQARQHVEAPVPRISERSPRLPAALDGVFLRALAKDPAERPGTAEAFVEDLEGALRDREQSTTRAIPATPPRRPRRSMRVPATLAVVAALAGAGAVVALAMSGDDEPRQRARATPTATAERPATTRERTATTTTPAATTPAPTADGRSPAQLNDEGYALIRQEQYAAAVPLLQRSVEGFRSAGRTGDLGYAFALYNLAYALARTGQEDQAVPLLQERLRVSDNQRGTVRKELRRIQTD
jgi:serine/threonine-protein kinase